MEHLQDNKSQVSLRSIWIRLDWWTVVVYLILMIFGWISICGASFDFDEGGDLFSLSTRSGMQLAWIGTSLILAFVLLLLDDNIYDSLAYIIYVFLLVLLIITPFLAHDIKGSLSWIKLGNFSLQPAEFAKCATALALAKYMSTYGYDITRRIHFVRTLGIILLPMILIIMQRETGSALVFMAFLIVLYREGMTGSVLFVGVAAVVYFVVGVRFADVMLAYIPTRVGEVSVLLLIFLFTIAMTNIYMPNNVLGRRILIVCGSVIVAGSAFAFFVIPFNLAWVVIGAVFVSIIWLLVEAFRKRLTRLGLISLFAVGSLVFFYSSDYVLNHVMQPHQRVRIHVLLGLEDDPRGAGYNVRQAEIAIGSGGLAGKGFLNGTQTKLKYVPEQDTDFIFCTVGEEEGFWGATLVLFLFVVLVWRIMGIAERAQRPFVRIYGYGVASVLMFHVTINVGMVLGLTPVIGIPLPFFSYGGSSLWGFTILLFILLRMDAANKRETLD